MGRLARTSTRAQALVVASPGPRSIAPVLAPSGRLKLQTAEGATALPPEQAARLYREFARGSGHGLLSLGLDDVGSPLPPSLAYWRQLATRYMAAVCALPDIAASERSVPPRQQRHKNGAYFTILVIFAARHGGPSCRS